MIKQLLNSGIAKYRDLSRRSIIYLSLRLRQIIYRLATDKSRYFAQPRPIIVNNYSAEQLKVPRASTGIRLHQLLISDVTETGQVV